MGRQRGIERSECRNRGAGQCRNGGSRDAFPGIKSIAAAAVPTKKWAAACRAIQSSQWFHYLSEVLAMSSKGVRFAICAVLTLGSALALAQDKSASTPLAPAKVASAMDAYWHDLAGALDGSTDAHALLAAALLDGFSQQEPKPDRFGELIARAQKAASEDALVWWIAATQCRGVGSDCAESQKGASEKLSQFDGRNAAVWLLDAAASQRAGDYASAEKAFAKAATATRYDDYMIASVKMLTAQFASHPPHEAARRSADGVIASSEAFAEIEAYAIAAAFLMPNMGVPFSRCTPSRKPVHDAVKANECLGLARIMQSGDSLTAVGVGLGIERRLLAGTPAAADVERRWRSNQWMLFQLLTLSPYMVGDSKSAQRYRSDLNRSNDERTAIAALMTARGIPLDPPADWKTSWQ